MSNVKLVPEAAEQLNFFQEYLKICQRQLPAGSTLPSRNELLISNRAYGDGKWQILWNDPTQDFFCSSEIDWKGREMTVLSGKLSAKNPAPIAVVELADACSGTRQLLGEEELAGQPCEDAGTDPRIEKAKATFTVQNFEKICSEQLGKFSLSRYGKDLSKTLSLSRVSVINDHPKDGAFHLLFKSKRYDFFCEGMADSLEHRMLFRSGSLAEQDSAQPDRAIELTDACSTTTLVAGAEELVGECKDRSIKEMAWERYLTLGFYGVLGLLANYQLAKWALKIWRWKAVVALRAAPVLRYAGVGYLTGKAFDELAGRGFGLAPENPVRKYGTYAAAATGAIAPEILKRTVATRLASTSLLAKAGSFVTKVGRGALLVGILDAGFGGVLDDYDQSVNMRATDRVYDEWVYSFKGVRKMEHWYDVLAVPLMPFRAGARFLASNSIEWAVADKNTEVREQVLAEDRQACEDELAAMRQIFGAMKDAPPEVQAEYKRQLLDAMAKPPETDLVSLVEMIQFQILEPEKLKAQGWTEEKIAELMQKKFVAAMQEGAKYMLGIQQDTDTIHWSRDVFTQEGTLKPEMAQKFLERLEWEIPAYLIEKTK